MDFSSNEFIHLKEARTDTENIFDGKVVKLVVDTVTLADGTVSKRERMIHHGAVAVIPIKNDGKIILVRQWRNAAECAMLEIPAGGLKTGEDPKVCAERELMEEIKKFPKELEYLTAIYLAPGYSSEKLYLYKATNLVDRELPMDIDERIDVVELTKDELLKEIKNGNIIDGKTVAAAAFLD